MSKVAVKSDLISWARERSGVASDELLKRFPKYREWESGAAQPTLRQLEALAKTTFTPLGYFFLPEPPEDRLPIPDFRTLPGAQPKRPSPNLLETIQTMQQRQGWMRDFLREQGQEPLAFVGSVSLGVDLNELAAGIRAALSLSNDWAHRESNWTEALKTLREATEDAGILVVINGVVGNNNRRKLDRSEFQGFVLTDEYAPLIFINGADFKAAQMFTLAHELAHLWLGRGGVFSFEEMQPVNNEVEVICNRAAAEFLVPAAQLQSVWQESQETDEPFQFLARHFKVSPIVAARRALDLQLMSRPEFFEFYHAYEEDDRRQKQTSSGGDFYATQGTRIGERFANTVIRAVIEGHLLFRDAYRLTGLYGKTFDRYADYLGFRL
ncbi:MAG: ImmA/IrrE family metallo-endopeptidase [Deltaproteobacteria bacterium]|nr:ImmA/IrrE family metallo-endopeptidase [Deltaproteobacteria bacterium]